MPLPPPPTTMAYVCELNPGHRVYLDNQENQTTVTTVLTMPGQQQQTSNTLNTGAWIAPPVAYRNDNGAIFKLTTAQGDVSIYIQGSQVTMTQGAATVDGTQQLLMQQTTTAAPMAPMKPMAPMPPMGNMEMTMNPMEMRMGTMELKMETAAEQPAPAAANRQFCSQCGTKVAPEDRFCSSCGHRLA